MSTSPLKTGVAEQLKANGWRSRRHSRGGHVMWYCPCGDHTLTTNSSSSRERKHSRTDLGRARRCPLWVAA